MSTPEVVNSQDQEEFAVAMAAIHMAQQGAPTVEPFVAEPDMEEEARRLYHDMDRNDDMNLSQKEIVTFIQGHQDHLLNEYFGGKDISNTKKKKMVQEFCATVAALDGVVRNKRDGSFDVSIEDWVQGYRQIRTAVLLQRELREAGVAGGYGRTVPAEVALGGERFAVVD
jgi:hypothetical protein